MILTKLASGVFNDIQSGLEGYTSNINMSLELLEDDIVQERLLVIKEYSLKNLIPKKDLLYSLNCILLDCKQLSKCCVSSQYGLPLLHFEIPQLINDFGSESIEFIGSVDKSVKFKVYTTPQAFTYLKYKMHKNKKPFVYIDTTPNSNNLYDGWIFNTTLLEMISVIGVFKDPRLVLEYSCCDMQDADNMSFIDTEVAKRVTEKKLKYYRQLYQLPHSNDQVAR